MPYLSMVFTVRFVAQKLGVDQAVVEAIAEDMRTKDGCLSVIDSANEDEPSNYAFTPDGIGYVGEMLAKQNRP
jgi:hypothetical protein